MNTNVKVVSSISILCHFLSKPCLDFLNIDSFVNIYESIYSKFLFIIWSNVNSAANFKVETLLVPSAINNRNW